jgi:hypothetical protein
VSDARAQDITNKLGDDTTASFTVTDSSSNDRLKLTADGTFAVGESCTASGENATVSGGWINAASGGYATISGGEHNTASGNWSTIGGGDYNEATGSDASVVGGYKNTASANYATVMGGTRNTASGTYSSAAGRYAHADLQGCYVWGDSSTSTAATCPATDSWVARASGGVYFYTNSAMTTGMYLASGGSAWNAVCDRAFKENFVDVDKRTTLKKLASLPVQEYNLKSQDPMIRHFGPVAQDFSATFGYGEDELTINTMDAIGVTMAAVQGLYALVQEKDVEVQELQAEIQALKRQNAELMAKTQELSQMESDIRAIKERLSLAAQR